MSDRVEVTREDLLALTPGEYLAEGWRGADGAVRPALLGMDATAVATQLVAAEASPQELAFTYEAMNALLEMQEEAGQDGGDAGGRMRGVVDEALMTVARMIRQPNNEGIAEWTRECAGFVRDEDDIEAMLTHVQAVLRLHALMAFAPPPGTVRGGGESSSGSSVEQAG